jgi:hypothetical protein
VLPKTVASKVRLYTVMFCVVVQLSNVLLACHPSWLDNHTAGNAIPAHRQLKCPPTILHTYRHSKLYL